MKDDSVRSVERAVALLRCFDLDTESLTLRELSEKLALAPSTTLRLARVLTNLGVLEKSKAKTYSLGNTLYLLGIVARAHFKLQRAVLPHMLEVRDISKEAVALYGMERGFRVCYEHVEALLSMRCVVRPGERFPLWAGAAGKCLLAHADPAIIEEEIGKAVPVTPTTIVDPELFRQELLRIRACGGEAISHGEREEGVISIAVPIFSAEGKVAFALSVAAPAARSDDEALDLRFTLLRKAARNIEQQLFP